MISLIIASVEHPLRIKIITLRMGNKSCLLTIGFSLSLFTFSSMCVCVWVYAHVSFLPVKECLPKVVDIYIILLGQTTRQEVNWKLLFLLLHLTPSRHLRYFIRLKRHLVQAEQSAVNPSSVMSFTQADHVKAVIQLDKVASSISL